MRKAIYSLADSDDMECHSSQVLTSEESKIINCNVMSWLRLSISFALMVIVCLLGLYIGVKRIRETIPYPRHMDKGYITDGALSIRKTNDWNPHKFNYSSFPVYLTTGAIALGYIRHSAKNLVHSISDIKSV